MAKRQPRPRPIRRPPVPPNFKPTLTGPRWRNYPWTPSAPAQPGMVIISSGFGLAVQAFLDDSIPKSSGAEPVFEEIARPKRKAAINWTGTNLLRLTVGCILDGFANNRSVEPEIQKLELMMQTRGPVGTAPPPVKVTGPVPHTNIVWFLESVDWGEAIYEGDHRVRQQFTMSLVERRELLVSLPKATKEKVSYKLVTVTGKDDLKDIAKKHLGNSGRWREILVKKGKKFVRPRGYKVKKGTKVKVPKN